MIRLLPVCMMSIALLPGYLMAADSTPQNVLLICVDDLKPILGCYGDRLTRTPHLDGLAAEGLVFDRAYCNQAVCSPSRNALLTGLRPQTLGIYDLATNFRKARPNAVTLGQHFQQYGYRTESLGKIFHVGHGNQDDAASWSVKSWKSGAPAYALPESTQNRRDNPRGARGTATESADVPDGYYADGQTAEEASRRLREAAQQPEQPFLLAVGFIRPHLPFVAPARYWNAFAGNDFALPALTSAPQGAPTYAPTSWGELRQYSDIPQQGQLDDNQIRQLIHGYYAATSYVDAQIGQVLETLESSGLADRTIVVVWGDHGWHLGDHGMWCKHTNYEQAARIPLLIRVPGGRAGVRSGAMVESVDVFPTLCDLAGVPRPEGVDGESLAEHIADGRVAGSDHVLHVYPRGDRIGQAVRTERYRLVEWRPAGADPGQAEFELYDYVEDPDETRNVASEHPELVVSLQKILRQYPEPLAQIRPAAAAGRAGKKANSEGEPDARRTAMFNRRDVNGDNQLTREEFLKGQPDPDAAPARFERFDVNRDGVLSRVEFVSAGAGKL